MSIDRGPLVSRDRLQLIMGLPMFAPLGPGSVETLAAQLDPIVVDEDAILIRQGDLGDRFYVLERGAAEADVDGTVVAIYRPGDGFGEIALLHDVPRPATVRATEPSRVMALDRTQFLAVLTEEPASMMEAGRLADEPILDTQNRRSADLEADDQHH
jgi:CRP-like cAMP-binding protein